MLKGKHSLQSPIKASYCTLLKGIRFATLEAICELLGGQLGDILQYRPESDSGMR
ncbi:helix-turn-helix domain-containing protein [Roseovarius albus]|uniref:helix-turn-helix domain-containing protein n=1 Tax=Roseovarius albus TaxID=1247867 RepID=UPI003521CF10